MSLRFCMITTFFPPYGFGGDAVGVQRLSEALVRRGHHVSVIHDVDAYEALARRRVPESALRKTPVDVHGLRSGVGALSPLLTQQLGRPVLNAGKIDAILAEGRFDVINFHNVSLVGGPAVLTAGTAIKLYTAHEHWLVCPTHVLFRHNQAPCEARECLRCELTYRRPPQWWRRTGHLARHLPSVDTFIALTEFSRQKHAEFGFPYHMEVLPPFIPDGGADATARRSTRPHPRPYFLFAGRLERLKGLDDVIPVFTKDVDADLVIAGDGTHASALRALAGGNPRVTFLGAVPFEQLRPYYRHALALVAPSIGFETFGIVLIEAFREGTPVLARRIGPYPEIVEQSGAGLLFGSADELAAAMERVRTTPGLRDGLGRAGIEATHRLWSEDVVVSRYLDIVRRTGERKGPLSARRTSGPVQISTGHPRSADS